MLLGFLEADWTGLFAGLVLGNVAMFLLPISLIPYAGFPLWYLFTTWLFDKVGLFLPISSLSSVILLITGILASLIFALTTILSSAGIWFLVIKKRRTLSIKQTLNVPDSIKTIIKNLPKLDFSITGIQDLINKIIDFIKAFIEKIDMNLITDVVFWLGLGIAVHDFWWESQEENVNATRPTHGVDIGLEMALFALDYQISMTTPNLFERIKKEIPLYAGFVSAEFGFLLTKILPKGFPRIICHFFWWTGIGLMVYNWYQENESEIFTKKTNRKV
jgi:hypothetical protein